MDFETFSLQFESKPQSLDAAYERMAMWSGLVDKPCFPENIINDQPQSEE